MGEASQQQVLNLLYEVSDGISDIRAELHEVLVEARILNYEMELGLQQIAEVRSRYYEKVRSS